MKRFVVFFLTLCLLCPTAQAQSHLTILNANESIFLEKYQAEHGDVNIDLQWPQIWGNAYLNDLMTNPNYDLLQLTVGSVFARLMEEGYLMPIEDAAVLTWIDSCYPELKDVLSYEGKLYGVPAPDDIGSPITTWAYSPESVEDAGLSKLPCTWNELLTLMADWDPDNPYRVFEGYDILSLTETIISDYLLRYDAPNASFAFDTSAFRETMKALKNWKETEQIGDMRPSLIMISPIYFSQDAGDEISDDCRYIAPMTFLPGEEPIITLNMLQVWCISRRTQNMDIVLELLAEAANNMPDHIRYVTVPGTIVPIKDRISLDTANNVNELMQYLRISKGSLFGDHQYEIIDEVRLYLEGNLSLDLLVQKLDAMIEMITLERS